MIRALLENGREEKKEEIELPPSWLLEKFTATKLETFSLMGFFFQTHSSFSFTQTW